MFWPILGGCPGERTRTVQVKMSDHFWYGLTEVVLGKDCETVSVDSCVCVCVNIRMWDYYWSFQQCCLTCWRVNGRGVSVCKWFLCKLLCRRLGTGALSNAVWQRLSCTSWIFMAPTDTGSEVRWALQARRKARMGWSWAAACVLQGRGHIVAASRLQLVGRCRGCVLWCHSMLLCMSLLRSDSIPEVIIITLRASCGAVYCNRSCLWVGVWVGMLPR